MFNLFGKKRRSGKKGSGRRGSGRGLGAMHPKVQAMARKMKACAVEWNCGDKRASTYRAHVKACLKE